MGNCIKKQSSMEWGGDDWSEDYSDISDKKTNLHRHNNDDDYNSIKEKTGSLAPNDGELKEPKQVKLKITRKQLEQVLKLTKTDIQGVSVEELLAHLINGGIDDVQSNQTRSWRPELPTITEL
ncbi:hypothetical protein DCAR_0623606 [Daucus carota subsp. sativus]|uniref:Uncharacterized protein n=1 Tax=Daucus carota subsp. sativus TaxID=79200 RepID=A0A164VB46_DAUCS|nr:PREDICTED: uncharacterized protein LOC108226546 [Daucus carota subsp. sativus]WOH04197.1 hypothetical protein DCAR_0623606 [Daucus carota subsp. sativus]